MDRGPWQATVLGVAESQSQLTTKQQQLVSSKILVPCLAPWSELMGEDLSQMLSVPFAGTLPPLSEHACSSDTKEDCCVSERFLNKPS